jgi:ribosomal protein S18 acetylase RimI-like enzyme
MLYILRALTAGDQPFLWEMLYQALYVPTGQPAPPRTIINQPELARYVEGWGREGDRGFLVYDAHTEQPVGAIWLRLLVGDNKGYGYIDDETPELGIAVLPAHRGQGIGTQLLRALLDSPPGQFSLSLSVSVDNPAVKLYKRFGFVVVRGRGRSLVMKR